MSIGARNWWRDNSYWSRFLTGCRHYCSCYHANRRACANRDTAQHLISAHRIVKAHNTRDRERVMSQNLFSLPADIWFSWRCKLLSKRFCSSGVMGMGWATVEAGETCAGAAPSTDSFSASFFSKWSRNSGRYLPLFVWPSEVWCPTWAQTTSIINLTTNHHKCHYLLFIVESASSSSSSVLITMVPKLSARSSSSVIVRPPFRPWGTRVPVQCSIIVPSLVRLPIIVPS